MTRKDESAEAKARKQARKDMLGRAGRALRRARSGGRMEATYSDDDLRVGRAVQQKGTPHEKTFADRQAADTRPNKRASNLRNKGVRASTELVRGARLALAEKVLEAVDKKTAETNRRFFANLPPSAAQKTKEKLVQSAEEKGKGFDRIADRNKKG